MIVWLESERKTLDLWSYAHRRPDEDAISHLTSTIDENSVDGATVFETRRKLDTGAEQDFAIQVDTDMIWCYGVRQRDGRWKKHDIYEVFGIRINSDGTIATELDVQQLDVPTS